MKVAIINNVDVVGGAARAAFRIHNALNESSVAAQMIVGVKSIDLPTIQAISETNFNKLLVRVKPFYDKAVLRKYPKRSDILFSTGKIGTKVIGQLSDFDIIHLNWINSGFLSLNNIRQIASLGKPIVWTLHDMWPFTGGCHHSLDCEKYKCKCGSCPILGSKIENDLSRKVWSNKHDVFSKAKISVVACSRWMKQCAEESSLFSQYNIETILHPINTNVFKPINKNLARSILNLPENKLLIMFGAMSAATNPLKGYRYVKEAVQILNDNPQLKDRIELVVMGAYYSKDENEFACKVNFLGHLHDDYTMVLAYSAADVFVAPSIAEAMSNTVMEALSCGTPVVAFNVGGIPDMVDSGINGFLCEPRSSEDLANGVVKLLSMDDEQIGKFQGNARTKVLNNYTNKIVAKKYIKLYESLLDEK